MDKPLSGACLGSPPVNSRVTRSVHHVRRIAFEVNRGPLRGIVQWTAGNGQQRFARIIRLCERTNPVQRLP